MEQVLLSDSQGSDEHVATGESFRFRMLPGSIIQRSMSCYNNSADIVDLDHRIVGICCTSISMASQILVLSQSGKYKKLKFTIIIIIMLENGN